MMWIACSGLYGQGLADRINLHGFGGWGFGRTDGNDYLFGAEDPDFDNAAFTLNISARLTDEVKAVAQVSMVTRGSEHLDEDLDTQLDYAFAEWTISDALRLRFGRVKQPFGIYTEIFAVGTLRPFVHLPQGIYGPQGFTANSYNGVGATGSLFGSGGWGFDYDLYAGAIDTNIVVSTLTFEDLIVDDTGAFLPVLEFDFVLDDVVGGRGTVNTPLDGLIAGFSVFRGELEEEPNTFVGRWLVNGLFVEYLAEPWLVRAEYATYDLANPEAVSFDSEGLYVEIAHRFGPNWQVATRYDWWALGVRQPRGAPVSFTDLGMHRDLAVGVNYWHSPGFVLKVSLHQVRGNRFAYPIDLESAQLFFDSFQLERDTSLIQFGAQFSF